MKYTEERLFNNFHGALTTILDDAFCFDDFKIIKRHLVAGLAEFYEDEDNDNREAAKYLIGKIQEVKTRVQRADSFNKEEQLKGVDYLNRTVRKIFQEALEHGISKRRYP